MFLPLLNFVAGTLVLMADGTSKPIEGVKVGDWVVTRNENANENAPASIGQVTQTFAHVANGTVIINFKDGSAVQCTDGHKFYVVGKGFEPAAELHPGDITANRAGNGRAVANVTCVDLPARVYNFGVSNSHTYFVGGKGHWTWVHNMFCSVGPKPSLSAVKNAVREAEEAIGEHIGGAGRGTSRLGSPMRSSGKKGYRLDPGHDPMPGRNPDELGPHINWYDWTGGKSGRGGREGVIPIR